MNKLSCVVYWVLCVSAVLIVYLIMVSIYADWNWISKLDWTDMQVRVRAGQTIILTIMMAICLCFGYEISKW